MSETSQTSRMRSAEHFLGLRYPVTVRELSPEEDGGFVAAIPLLGDATFTAYGDTREEALTNLDALRQELIPRLLAKGMELPEPHDDDEEESIDRFSGNLLIRMPRSLHAKLSAMASRNNCSINKLATQLLAGNLERLDLIGQAKELLEEMETRIARATHDGAQTWRTEQPIMQTSRPLLKVEGPDEYNRAA